MESFLRRLKFYGIGFGIGLVFVFFFFKNRGCSWTPSNRVKNTVLDRLIVVSDSTKSVLDAKGISMKEVVQVLNDGDVLFSESNKDNKDKAYLMERNGVKFVFTLPHESFVSEVFLSEKVKGIKPSVVGYGNIIHYPADDNLIFSDTTARVVCQQDILGLISDKKIFGLIKKNGKIDFAKTDFTVHPKPVHYFVFEYNGKEIGAEAIWYKSKLNVTSYYHPSLDECK